MESSGLEAEALEYLDQLFAAACRLTRDPMNAEDLVQETYLKVLRFRERFERGTNLRAWLFTILHNTFRNMVRGDARDPVEVDSETIELAAGQGTAGESPEAALLRGTLDQDLKAALDALPAGYRQAVWLRDVEEFSYAEISGILEIPIGTVMSRISRGRRMLYERLTSGVGARVPKRRPARDTENSTGTERNDE